MALTDRYVTSAGAGTYAGSTSPAAPMSLATAFTNAVAGDRINIKNDATYSRASTDSPANAGTITSPIIYRGYSSTIGDGNQGRTNTNGALITTNMPLIAYASTFKLTPVGGFLIFESLNITGSVTTAANAMVVLQTDTVVKSCKMLNSGATGSGYVLGMISAAPNCVVFDNDLEQVGTATSHVIDAPGVAQRIIANRIKGGVGVGVALAGTGSPVVIGNVIYSSGGIGIASVATGARGTIYGNTIVGGTVEGINILTGSTGLQCIVENLITDNTTYGIEYVSTSNGAFSAYNRFRDNTTANTHNAGDWITATGYGDITTGNGTTDYVNKAGDDYNLVATSPAVATGWFRYGSIGALDPQRTTGSTRIPSIGG